MQIIKCAHCYHENRVYSSRIVFCGNCEKKLQNNFIDWSKEKHDSSFEKYVNELTEYNSNFQSVGSTQDYLNRTVEQIPDTKINIKQKYYHVTLLILIFGFTIAYLSSLGEVPSKTNWTKISIDDKIILYSPYPISEAESLLPLFFNHYIDSEKSRKVAIPEYFSLSVDLIDINETVINSNDLISIDDNFIIKANVLWKDKNTICQFRISNYKVYLQSSEITYNGKNYYYDNYTLINKDKCAKIIIHTLKDNSVTERYRDEIVKSILINKI